MAVKLKTKITVASRTPAVSPGDMRCEGLYCLSPFGHDRPVAGFDEFLQTLEDFEHLKGARFEQATKWWLEHDPVWSSQLKKVWLWSDWPDRSTRDIGIDLVAKAHDGSTWAFQCKAESPERPLTKARVDSFLATSSSPRFSKRALITTCKSLSANLQSVLADQSKSVVVVDWGALDGSDVDWRQWQKQTVSPPRPRPVRPYRHQEAAIQDLAAHLRRQPRVQLRMACGTGKTLVGIRLAQLRKEQLVVVAVPGLVLLGQWIRDWIANAEAPIEWIAVCSDESVGPDRQDFSTTFQSGLPVTTRSADIAAFVRRRGTKVVFTTYQSAAQVGKALRSANRRADLVISDEAHRLAGAGTHPGRDILDDSKFPARRRIFMTATPRVFTANARSTASESGVSLDSMDDLAVFGPIAHDYPLSKAIRDRRLNDYRLVIVGVDSQSVRQKIGARRLVKVRGKTLDAEALGTYVAIEKAVHRFNLKRLISFHSRVTRASDFCDTYPKVRQWLPTGSRSSGVLKLKAISGAMSFGLRRSLLQELRSLDLADRMIISNARCLTEGVDVPSLDGVVFVDPRFSQVDIVQAVGRAIRKSRDGNDVGTIIVPIFVDPKGDVEEAISQSDFARVASVINALRAHDETLGEELDRLRLEMGRRGKPGKLPEKIVWDLPQSVDRKFAQGVSLLVLERTSSTWSFQYGQLLKFVDKFGHAQVPQTFGRGEVGWRGLGTWVSAQRSKYRSKRLTPAECESLESLPGWSWSPKAEAWDIGFAETQSAVRELGSIQSVPRNHKSESDYRVGQWIQVQRSTAGRRTLTRAQTRRLESLPGWSWDPREDQWERGYAAAKKWLRANESLPPQDLEVDASGQRLSNWFKVNLKAYRDPESTLSAARRERLAALPHWRLLADPYLRRVPKHLRRVPKTWKGVQFEDVRQRFGGKTPGSPVEMHALADFLDSLEAFYEELGHLDVPTREGSRGKSRPFQYRGFALGQKVNKYRSEYSAGTLDDWKIEAIEAVGPWMWDARDAAWERGFRALEEYTERNGHAQVPQTLEWNGFTLGSWVARQRRTKARLKLNRDRQQRLRSLPGWTWDASGTRVLDKRNANWEQKYSLLEAFCSREGHALVPSGHVEDGVALGRWVSYLRGAKRGKPKGAKRPSLEEQRRLESLPGWSWDPRPQGSGAHSTNHRSPRTRSKT